jgi:hypothetical protein
VYTEQVLASVAVLFVKVRSETRKAVLPQQWDHQSRSSSIEWKTNSNHYHFPLRVKPLFLNKNTTLCVLDNSTNKDSLGAWHNKAGMSGIQHNVMAALALPSFFPAVLAGTSVTRSTANTMIDPAAVPDPGVGRCESRSK